MEDTHTTVTAALASLDHIRTTAAGVVASLGNIQKTVDAVVASLDNIHRVLEDEPPRKKARTDPCQTTYGSEWGDDGLDDEGFDVVDDSDVEEGISEASTRAEAQAKARALANEMAEAAEQAKAAAIAANKVAVAAAADAARAAADAANAAAGVAEAEATETAVAVVEAEASEKDDPPFTHCVNTLITRMSGNVDADLELIRNAGTFSGFKYLKYKMRSGKYKYNGVLATTMASQVIVTQYFESPRDAAIALVEYLYTLKTCLCP